MAAPLRVCFFGDSFVNGTGDDACLGWVGRACAAGRRNGTDLTCYNLGIRGDTSADVLRRWEHEARARLAPEHDGRLVFSFGAIDCCLRDDASQVRVPVDQALANARMILASALAWRPTLMVGPLPVCDRETDGRIATMSAALAPLCVSLGVRYLEVFHHAANSSSWACEVAAGDGAHPNAIGYTAVSDAFHRWAPWQACID